MTKSRRNPPADPLCAGIRRSQALGPVDLPLTPERYHRRMLRFPTHRFALATALLLCVFAACAREPATPRAATAADTRPSVQGYTRVPRTPDGIGKAYMGREIAGIMGWQGAAWLERAEREREEGGALLLKELRLKPGMRVADVGAGTGWYTRRIAPRVAPGGKVYAVDVQPQMVEMLRQVAAQPRYANVVPVLGGGRDPRLAPGSIDLALMVDVYHELEYPAEMLDAIVRALAPGGRVAFVEYRAEDDAVPIKPLHKMSEAQIRREAQRHGLTWERTARSLPWQHVVVFRKR